eukprot:94361-Pyramimonas_sp.AAC.1
MGAGPWPTSPLAAKTCPDAIHSRRRALRAARETLAAAGALRSTVLHGSGLCTSSVAMRKSSP